MKSKGLKRIFAAVTALALVLSVSSCGERVKETDTDQLALPKIGEEIAVMHTTEGDIYFRLFPEDAPKAVENFKYHAEKSNYKNLSVFRSEPNYLIQSGDFENNDGTGGESKWKKGFSVEISNSLHNIRGALGVARAEKRDSQGSQFYVVTRGYASVAFTEQLKDSDPELAKKYEENGGIPELDGDYTVFGQAFAGFDALDAINKKDTTDEEDTSVEATIISIEIVRCTEDILALSE